MKAKILSLVIISLMIASCIGSVSAKQYDYYWDFNVGDQLEYQDGSGNAEYIKINGVKVNLPHYARCDLEIIFQENGREFLNNYKSDGYTVTGTFKKGLYTIKTDSFWWSDPNYFHITVHGIPTKLQLISKESKNITVSDSKTELTNIKLKLLNGNNEPLINKKIVTFSLGSYNIFEGQYTDLNGIADFNFTNNQTKTTKKYINFYYSGDDYYGGSMKIVEMDAGSMILDNQKKTMNL
ncbi:MAG: hypothetical protein LBC39_04945 [Methanobrevibacter sp.]|jgi:hypothetical protein|nr:hypothetical protein [Candidatus Methanovirga aequatorialis]